MYNVRKGFYFKQNFQTKVSKFIIKIITLEHIRIIILKDHVTRLMAAKVMAALYLHYYSMKIKHLFEKKYTVAQAVNSIKTFHKNMFVSFQGMK